jgi:hypothetical protein
VAKNRRQPNRGKARIRAIRARMARTGEPFTVAARRHDEELLVQNVARWLQRESRPEDLQLAIARFAKQMAEQQLAAIQIAFAKPAARLAEQIIASTPTSYLVQQIAAVNPAAHLARQIAAMYPAVLAARHLAAADLVETWAPHLKGISASQIFEAGRRADGDQEMRSDEL